VKRRLFNLAAAVSLLLCVATMVLWVRSYWRPDLLLRDRRDLDGSRRFGVRSSFGELDGEVFRSADPPSPGWLYFPSPNPWDQPLSVSRNRRPELRSASLFGFGYGFSNLHPFHAIWVPHWFLALLFAVLPAVRLRPIIRRRRQYRAGLCHHCGYDLRATPDRCPECGAQAKPQPAEGAAA
jgi:hypothetical protein